MLPEQAAGSVKLGKPVRAIENQLSRFRIWTLADNQMPVWTGDQLVIPAATPHEGSLNLAELMQSLVKGKEKNGIVLAAVTGAEQQTTTSSGVRYNGALLCRNFLGPDDAPRRVEELKKDIGTSLREDEYGAGRSCGDRGKHKLRRKSAPPKSLSVRVEPYERERLLITGCNELVGSSAGHRRKLRATLRNTHGNAETIGPDRQKERTLKSLVSAARGQASKEPYAMPTRGGS